MARLNNRKKVYQYDLNGNYVRSFDSMKEASEHTGAHVSAISNCCSRKQQYTGDYTYRREFLGDSIKLDDSTIPPAIPEEAFPLTAVNKARNGKGYREIYCIDINGCWEIVSHTSKGSSDFDEYPRVNFCGKNWKLSRLVYTIYKNKSIGGKNYVMHICDNPKCVNPEHLVEGTPTENNHDMIDKGRNSAPPVNNKLTANEVAEIFNSNEDHNTLAKTYGVVVNNIYAIKNGILWSDITGKKYEPRGLLLTDKEVVDIYTSEKSNNELANEYGVSYSYVYNIRNNTSRTDITKGLR